MKVQKTHNKPNKTI